MFWRSEDFWINRCSVVLMKLEVWHLYKTTYFTYPSKKNHRACLLSKWFLTYLHVITISDEQSDEIQNSHAKVFRNKWIWWCNTNMWHWTIVALLYWKVPQDISIVRKLQGMDYIIRNSYCKHVYIKVKYNSCLPFLFLSGILHEYHRHITKKHVYFFYSG